MTVKSKPLASPTRAPLNRRDIDRALPWLRLLLGAGLIGFSAVTTVTGVRDDCGPLCAGAWQSAPVWAVVGLGVAALISLGQWLSSGRWQLVYSVLLLIDARYTQKVIGPPIEALAAYHMDGAQVAWVVAAVVSWGLALLTARFGEVLLFGRRKGGGDVDGPGDRPAGDGDGAGAARDR